MMTHEIDKRAKRFSLRWRSPDRFAVAPRRFELRELLEQWTRFVVLLENHPRRNYFQKISVVAVEAYQRMNPNWNSCSRSPVVPTPYSSVAG